MKVGVMLILQMVLVLGGLLGSDVALAYDAQQRYNERYEYCMKTDDRGAAYCRKWAGPSESSRRPYISSIDERLEKFKNCVIEERQEVEYCEKFLDPSQDDF